VEIHDSVRQTTDDNIIRGGKMRYGCRITKAVLHTHTQTNTILLPFHGNNDYAKHPIIAL